MFQFETVETKLAPAQVARSAGLRYVSDNKPGIRRELHNEQYIYYKPDGSRIDEEKELERIKSLAIPPAYTDVWICPNPNGHLQATARDAKGRKQYRYHKKWRETRDETKYGRMRAFGDVLPIIYEKVKQDLARPGLPREKVLAIVVQLLETTLIRVGNEEYARTNRSYGLTTLRNRHVDISGTTIKFKFKGKSNINHVIELKDRRLARMVKRCRDLPGHELFQYLDDEGQPHSIDSGDVNQYLQEITGQSFTAKDFRTWAGTILVALSLEALGPAETDTAAKRNVLAAIKEVAGKLGNTPAICRKCYVHPEIVNAYMDGSLFEVFKNLIEENLEEKTKKLSPKELAVMRLLEKRLAG